MNGELKRVDITGMAWLMERHLRLNRQDTETMLNTGRVSDPLLAGMFEDELICFVGFVPVTLLSEQAYLWMYSAPGVERHKIMVGRFGRRLVVEALKRYPTITGHCSRATWRWLYSLGAEIAEAHGDYFSYVIKAPNV